MHLHSFWISCITCKLGLHVWLQNFLTFHSCCQSMAKCAVQPSEKSFFFSMTFSSASIMQNSTILLHALFVWVDLVTCTTVIFCASFVNLRKENMQILFFSCCRGSVPDKMNGGEEGEREEVLSKKEKRRVTTTTTKQLKGRLGAPEKRERGNERH